MGLVTLEVIESRNLESQLLLDTNHCCIPHRFATRPMKICLPGELTTFLEIRLCIVQNKETARVMNLKICSNVRCCVKNSHLEKNRFKLIEILETFREYRYHKVFEITSARFHSGKYF